MAKKKYTPVDPSKVEQLPGRTIDYDSGLRAFKRSRHLYHAMMFWLVIMLFSMFPIIILRISGEFNGGVNSAFYLMPMTVLCYITAFFMVKGAIYSGGESSLEQLDKNGSPFLGRLLYKNGLLRVQHFLFVLLLVIFSYAINLIYVYVTPTEDMSYASMKETLSALLFMASTLVIACEWYAVMNRRWRVFFGKTLTALKEHVPVFFAFQIVYTLISALLYLIIVLLSRDSSSEVVESLTTRILDGAFETTSVSGFLIGGSSVLASLTASSMYVSLIDGVVDVYRRKKGEKAKTYSEQFAGMVKDPNNIRTLVMLALSLLYVGIANIFNVGAVINTVMKLAIFLVWLYNGYKFVIDLHIQRYTLVTLSIIYVDQLIVLPSITSFRSFVLAVGIFVLRTVLFVIIGVMAASLISIKDEWYENQDMSLSEYSKAITGGKGVVRDFVDSMKEERAVMNSLTPEQRKQLSDQQAREIKLLKQCDKIYFDYTTATEYHNRKGIHKFLYDKAFPEDTEQYNKLMQTYGSYEELVRQNQIAENTKKKIDQNREKWKEFVKQRSQMLQGKTDQIRN